MTDYLYEVAIPNFQQLIDQKNVCSAIKDNKGRIVCATALYAKESGFEDWRDLIGVSYNSNLEKIEEISRPNDKQILLEIKKYCNKLAILEQAVIVERTVASYIELFPYQNFYKSSIGTMIPIMDLTGNAVGIQVFFSAYELFGIEDYFKQFQQPNKTLAKFSESVMIESVKLTRRELEITYLLAHGFSQYQISGILQITRGTVSKIISNQICPKFNIHGSNTKLLINKVKKLDYLKNPPQSLLKPLIIILDDNINRKYFPTLDV